MWISKIIGKLLLDELTKLIDGCIRNSMKDNNKELYKYTLHATDELHEFRDINDLNLVFIINNKNQIELKNKDDFNIFKLNTYFLI